MVLIRKGLMIGLLALLALPLWAQDAVVSTDLQAVLDEFAAADGPAVVIQITTPDETYTATAGRADSTRAATSDDSFRIGSVSKTYVAALTLLLVEDGLIELDDKAANYLPADVVENIANLDTATIRQLLAMRSGIDDYLATDGFWQAIMDEPARAWTAEAALEYAYGLDPLFAPDAEYNYSNTNYVLMQLILERVSSQPLHVLMRERMLDPLTLRDTYTQGAETGDLVSGYEDMDGDGTAEDVSDLNDGWGLADGGLVSTAADLTAFYQALLVDQTLLSEESMAALLNFEDDGQEGLYSLGLEQLETEYGTAWGHSGGVSGFVSQAFYLEEEETIVVVFVASQAPDPYEIAIAGLEVVLGAGEEE